MKIQSIRWDNDWKFQGVIEINNETFEFESSCFYDKKHEAIIVNLEELVIYNIIRYNFFINYNKILKLIEIELNEKYSREASYQYYQDQLDMKEDIDFKETRNN